MEGLCKVCGKPTKLICPSWGYRPTCSRECSKKLRSTGQKTHIRGTLEYFKLYSWRNINNRSVNGSNFQDRYRSYKKKNIQVLMSKDDFYNWCDNHAEEILYLYRDGKTPTVDRINSDGNYEIENIRVLDKDLNSLLGSKIGCIISKKMFGKNIVRVDLNTGEKKKYNSVAETELDGFNSGHVSRCVNKFKGFKSHKGYMWLPDERVST